MVVHLLEALWCFQVKLNAVKSLMKTRESKKHCQVCVHCLLSWDFICFTQEKQDIARVRSITYQYCWWIRCEYEFYIITEDNGAGGEQASNTSDTSEDKDKESKDIQMEDPVCITMEYFRFVNSLLQVQAGLIQVLQDCYK